MPTACLLLVRSLYIKRKNIHYNHSASAANSMPAPTTDVAFTVAHHQQTK